jgi:hypothetical protein
MVKDATEKKLTQNLKNETMLVSKTLTVMKSRRFTDKF